MEGKLSSANGSAKTVSTEERAHKFEPLKTAVEDLLCELRIDPTCLRIMAAGYSPDYSGVSIPPIEEGDPPNIEQGEKWINPHPKVQLSRIVAGKLLNTLDLQNKQNEMEKEKITIVAPIKVKPSKNYLLVIEDAEGIIHYFHKKHTANIEGKAVHFAEGEYDGWSEDVE